MEPQPRGVVQNRYLLRSLPAIHYIVLLPSASSTSLNSNVREFRRLATFAKTLPSGSSVWCVICQKKSCRGMAREERKRGSKYKKECGLTPQQGVDKKNHREKERTPYPKDGGQERQDT